MAKKPIEVNRAALEQAIQDAENENQFSTLTALWQDVAKRYNAAVNPPKALSPSVVYLRVREWKLSIKTKPGKRGGTGEHLRGANRAPRTSRATKFGKRKDGQMAFAAMRERLKDNDAERFLPLVDRIEKGSLTAAVKLHCLDCCAYQTPEVRRCSDPGCGMYLFRPYQGAMEEDEDKKDTSEAA